MNSNIKRTKILTIIMSAVSLLVIFAVGYAFFSSTVSNANKETITVGSATISLEFDDNDNGVSGTLNLGQSITKKFTLENTGTVDAYGKINWYNLVNTYTANSLTWTLEQSTSENGTYTSIGTGKVPVSNAETTETLKNSILVPVNTTYYYKLTITLNNLDVNQNSDINAAFSSYFNLEEGTLSGVNTIQNLVAGSPTDSVDVITRPVPMGATCTNTLAYDGTVDNNLRYVGANPCNYVTFNEEVAGWRIVGIMNNVDDGTGNLETRIKLIRNESLGNYSWDTSALEVNSGYGVNDWTQADLKNELNGDYLNTSLVANTNWYNGRSNLQSATFDYTKRLSTEAQELIGDTKWNLGGFTNTNTNLIPSTMYVNERGATVYSGRPTTWTGKVALIYPSDYGYATMGGPGAARSECIGTLSTTSSTTPRKTWRNNYNSDCKNNDWLNPSSDVNWLLSPLLDIGNHAFYATTLGIVNDYYTYNAYAVLPSVYLKSDVSFSSGSGTESDPYIVN